MADSQGCMPDESKKQLRLYNYWRSSCSWRVRIALAYKGIQYEYIAVNILKGEHLTEEYTGLNPLHLVPTLEDGDFVVSDSLAILEYLEEKFPEPALLPVDLKKRAMIRQAVNCVVASIQPLQNTSVLALIKEKVGPSEDLEWAQYFIENGFTALEMHLTKTAGKYCFGDDFTLADVVLLPQINNALRYKVDMAKFPTLQRIGTSLKELPWIQESLPEKQPDAVLQ
eukprot:c18044_g1_i1 orf=696-1373(-)